MDSSSVKSTRDKLMTVFSGIRGLFSKNHAKSTLPEGVVILTTLNPKNPKRQMNALENWRQLNVPVISLNVKSEQKDLVRHYPWVQFVVPSKTAEHIVGRPFVLFDAFLHWFSRHKRISHIVILNSDISVPTDPEFWTSAVQLAGESLLFGNRLDVNFQNSEQDKVFKVGFDFFILSRKLISCYPPSEFCLGAPWWDYWVPFVPLMQNIPCVHVEGNFAKHEWHETQWDIELYFHYCREFISHAEGFGFKVDVPAEVTVNNQITCKDFANRTSQTVLAHIHEKSETVTLSG